MHSALQTVKIVISSIKSQKRYVNRYFPEHVPFNLKWYERDSYMRKIDQLKYSGFSQDPDQYLKNVTAVLT